MARGRSPKAAPSIRAPPFAKEEKARAISSGLTGSAPRPIAKYGLRWRVIPSRCAIVATFPGPTSSVSCAKILLSELIVAFVKFDAPTYSLS